MDSEKQQWRIKVKVMMLAKTEADAPVVPLVPCVCCRERAGKRARKPLYFARARILRT